MSPRVLVLDHRDSFVFNAVEELARAGARVEVLSSDVPADRLRARIEREAPSLVVLSPGPGAPAAAGVFPAFLAARPRIPLLGICLGMQAVVEACGGRVARREPVHGRASRVEHAGDPLFDRVPSPFAAGRYHSLFAAETGPELEVIARTADGVPMAVRHRTLPWIGVQFHPESVLTPHGPRLLRNVLAEACRASHSEVSR